MDAINTESREDLRGFYFLQTHAERDLTPDEQFYFIGGIYEGSHPTDIVRRTYFETVFISGEEIITGRDPTDPEKIKSVKYLYHNQQFSTFPNWNICNAILICSSDLPINGEYYPCVPDKGWVSHTLQ